jgi:hypothetical protein
VVRYACNATVLFNRPVLGMESLVNTVMVPGIRMEASITISIFSIKTPNPHPSRSQPSNKESR